MQWALTGKSHSWHRSFVQSVDVYVLKRTFIQVKRANFSERRPTWDLLGGADVVHIWKD